MLPKVFVLSARVCKASLKMFKINKALTEGEEKSAFQKCSLLPLVWWSGKKSLWHSGLLSLCGVIFISAESHPAVSTIPPSETAATADQTEFDSSFYHPLPKKKKADVKCFGTLTYLKKCCDSYSWIAWFLTSLVNSYTAGIKIWLTNKIYVDYQNLINNQELWKCSSVRVQIRVNFVEKFIPFRSFKSSNSSSC